MIMQGSKYTRLLGNYCLIYCYNLFFICRRKLIGFRNIYIHIYGPKHIII